MVLVGLLFGTGMRLTNSDKTGNTSSYLNVNVDLVSKVPKQHIRPFSQNDMKIGLYGYIFSVFRCHLFTLLKGIYLL